MTAVVTTPLEASLGILFELSSLGGHNAQWNGSFIE
jgi:hypothetical protein